MNDPTCTHATTWRLVVGCMAVDARWTRVIIFFFTFSLYAFCYFDVYDDRSCNGNLYISSAACVVHSTQQQQLSDWLDCAHQQNLSSSTTRTLYRFRKLLHVHTLNINEFFSFFNTVEFSLRAHGDGARVYSFTAYVNVGRGRGAAKPQHPRRPLYGFTIAAAAAFVLLQLTSVLLLRFFWDYQSVS